MATIRKHKTAKDPRRVRPAVRDSLRRRVLASQDVCGICGNEVDKTLPTGNPLAPELDEIVPVSRGGSAYDIDNLQLTHAICNRRKGNKMESDPLPNGLNPIPNSTNW